MEHAVFLPKELKGYRKALKLWGVLVDPAEEAKVDPRLYGLRYQGKMTMMADRDRELGDDPQDLLEDQLAESWDRAADDEDLGERMSDYLELRKARTDMASYLRGEISLKELKEKWGLDLEQEEVLTEEEQFDLVRNLTLREFLDMIL